MTLFICRTIPVHLCFDNRCLFHSKIHFVIFYSDFYLILYLGFFYFIVKKNDKYFGCKEAYYFHLKNSVFPYYII